MRVVSEREGWYALTIAIVFHVNATKAFRYFWNGVPGEKRMREAEDGEPLETYRSKRVLAVHLFLSGYPVSEIACFCGCTERTVRKWLAQMGF